jgi:hypothetical protein
MAGGRDIVPFEAEGPTSPLSSCSDADIGWIESLLHRRSDFDVVLRGMLMLDVGSVKRLMDVPLTGMAILDAGSAGPPRSGKLFGCLDRDCRKVPLVFLMELVLWGISMLDFGCGA